MLIDEKLIALLKSASHPTAHSMYKNIEKLNQIILIDAELGLIIARKILETIAISSCRIFNITTDDKTLDKLLSDLKRFNHISDLIARHCNMVKDFGNLAAHSINQEQSISDYTEITQTEGELCTTSLNVVISWYCDKMFPKILSMPTLVILHGKNIQKEHLIQATEIDKEVYPSAYWINPKVLFEWQAINPDLFTIVLDQNENSVVGCVTALPLEPDVFSQIEQGDFNDLEIPPKGIQTYDLPDFYQLYIASVVIRPSHQGTDVFKIMYDAFIEKLSELAKREIFMVDLLADAITDQGLRLCKFIGMKEVKETQHDSKIYKLTMLPPSLRATTQKGKILYDYYKHKYEEIKELAPLFSF